MHFTLLFIATVLIAGAFARPEGDRPRFEDDEELQEGKMYSRILVKLVGEKRAEAVLDDIVQETAAKREDREFVPEEKDRDSDSDEEQDHREIAPEEGKMLFRTLVKLVGMKRAEAVMDDMINDVQGKRGDRDSDSDEKDRDADSNEKDRDSNSDEKDRDADSNEKDRDSNSEEEDRDMELEEGKMYSRILVKLVGKKRARAILEDLAMEASSKHEDHETEPEGRQRDFAPKEDDHDENSEEKDRDADSAEKDRDDDSDEKDRDENSAEKDHDDDSDEKDRDENSAEKDHDDDSDEKDRDENSAEKDHDDDSDEKDRESEEEEKKPSRPMWRPRSSEARKEAQNLLAMEVSPKEDSAEATKA